MTPGPLSSAIGTSAPDASGTKSRLLCGSLLVLEERCDFPAGASKRLPSERSERADEGGEVACARATPASSATPTKTRTIARALLGLMLGSRVLGAARPFAAPLEEEVRVSMIRSSLPAAVAAAMLAIPAVALHEEPPVIPANHVGTWRLDSLLDQAR